MYRYFLLYQGISHGAAKLFSTWTERDTPISEAQDIQALIEAQNRKTPGWDELTLVNWLPLERPQSALDAELAVLARLAQRRPADAPDDMPEGSYELRDPGGHVCGWIASDRPLGSYERFMRELQAGKHSASRVEVCAAEKVRCGRCLDCQVRQLQAEALSLRVDAARYRWLRGPDRQEGCAFDRTIDRQRAVH